MDQVVIFLIVAVFVGLRALFEKFKGAEKDFEARNPPPDRNLSGAPTPQLTDADRRYREIQDEIRRRVEQRQQQAQSAPEKTIVAFPPRPRGAPNMGLPPRTPPKPISTYQRDIPAPQTDIPTPIPTPVMATMDSTSEAAATEAMAYALPDSATGDTPIQARSRSAPAGSLRALLASKSSVRQAFVLREVLDRPLSLRSVYSGGHENWN